MTKRERIAQYNNLYPDFHITAIKRMARSELDNRIIYGAKSLDELYQSYSDDKRKSYAKIFETYQPNSILAVTGSSHAYSVLLVAWNGDKLLITKSNNYLVEVVEA